MTEASRKSSWQQPASENLTPNNVPTAASTRIYRVLRRRFARNPFDGEGAYLYGGRWSSPQVRLSYTSEHESLAMLEYFVHLDPDDAPDDIVLATAEVPNDVPREYVALVDLPPSWRETPACPELARFGDEFVERGESCVLLVPSVLAQTESNWLVNPKHPDFQKIVTLGVEPLRYDPRMFAPKRRHAKHKSR